MTTEKEAQLGFDFFAEVTGADTAERRTRTVVLDANNLAARCFHAARGRLTDVNGAETGSLHLFVTSLAKLLAEYRPDNFVACWDGGGSHFRQALYPAYKAARRADKPVSTETTQGQAFSFIHEFLELTGIAQWRIPGVEADDLIASAWYHHTEDSFVILSSDKDLLQLLRNDHTIQHRFANDGADVWTRARYTEQHGYSPDRIPLMMALTGDATDGVPGARGIGPVKAKKMLEAFDWDLEKIAQSLPDRDLVMTSLALVDLTVPEVSTPPVPQYLPLTRTSPDARERLERFTDFCQHHQLVQLWERLVAGTLWW